MTTDYPTWIILGIITLANFGLALVCIKFAKLAQQACRKALDTVYEDEGND